MVFSAPDFGLCRTALNNAINQPDKTPSSKKMVDDDRISLFPECGVMITLL
jgi:hypothetical protein